MGETKRFTKATWQIMEQLLEVDSLDDALSGSLEIIVRTLNSEAGAIWLLDPNTCIMINMFPERFFFDVVPPIFPISRSRTDSESRASSPKQGNP